MSTVFGYSVAAPGHLFSFIAVLLELQRRGHAVRLLVPATPDLPGMIAGIPIDHLVWERREEWKSGGMPAGDAASVERAWRWMVDGEPAAEILEQRLLRMRPDFLLVDPGMWGGIVAAEASGVAWGALATGPMMFRGAGLDVRGPGLPPPRGAGDHRVHQLVWSRLREANAEHLAVANAVRLARRLPPLDSLDDLYRIPPLTIATTAEPFEYPRPDWPSSLRFVGPLDWELPAAPTVPFQRRSDLPLVLLAGSSIAGGGAGRCWLETAFDALAAQRLEVVATLPRDGIPAAPPPNVSIHPFLPHSQILPQVSCVVCHGGPGITQKALMAGVPVVAVPFSHDRYEVARRVEVARAGVMVPGEELTAARLRGAIRRAIARKRGAERIAAAFRHAGGAGAAAKAIEDACGRAAGAGRSRRTAAGGAVSSDEVRDPGALGSRAGS